MNRTVSNKQTNKKKKCNAFQSIISARRDMQGFRPLTTGFEPARHLQAKIQSSTEEGDRRKNLFEAPQINHSGRSPIPYLAETLI